MRPPVHPRTVRAVLLAVLALSLALSAPAQAARQDCKQLYELYRTCHRYGAEADSPQACLEAAFDAMSKAEGRLGGKNPQGSHALAGLACSTGCEDALAGRERATLVEFTEAFCE
jgi:hypothetical protein